MTFNSQFLRVAEAVLRRRSNLSAREIVDIGISDQLFRDELSGKTPHQTMKSKLSTHIRRLGHQSTFVRTRPGRFGLRDSIPDQQIYESPPYLIPPDKERVLVFPSEVLDRLGRFQGIKTSKSFRRNLLKAASFTYLDRFQAEQNEEYKQVVSYILVRRGDELLGFRRGTYNRVEDFLRGSLCIGFGGHVTEADRNLFGQDDFGIVESAARELTEELRLPESHVRRLAHRDALSPLGVLNDDSSSVGRRHIAFLFAYDVTVDDNWLSPSRGERSITQLRWLDPARDVKLTRFEYWSQLCLLTYYRKVTSTPDSFVTHARVFKPPHLLCVLGPIGSGKTEATRVLRDDLGYAEINSGRIISQILNVPPPPETRRDLFQARAAEFIGRDDGPQRLAAAILEQARLQNTDRILIDGIRHRATLEALRRLAAPLPVAVLYVHTPPHVAFRFFQDREHSGASEVEFFRLRESPAEGDVLDMIRGADAVVYNWNGKLAYRKTILDLITGVAEGS